MQPALDLLRAWAAGQESSRAELRERYGPLLRAFARRVGLAEEATPGACEATLTGLRDSLLAAPVDPAPTRERLFEQARAHVAGASISASDVLQTEAALREAWESEWRQALLRAALGLLSRSPDSDARLLQAYDLHVIEKRSAAEVARELGMTATAVHSAKHLLLGALQKTLERLEQDF